MPKTIFITGTSSGIGKSTAQHFHRQGWNVIATMRKVEDGMDLAALENTLILPLDVTENHTIHAAVDAGIAHFGRIDVLLNNAGYGAYGPLEVTTTEAIQRQFATNVFGLIETTKAVIPHFRANHSGIVVNVSSVGGKIAFPLGALYHGTKFAVEGLTEALSFELRAIGAKVKLIEPGLIKTDFTGRSFEFSNDASLHEYQNIVEKLVSAFNNPDNPGSDPMLVAQTIYKAATDGSDVLRYVVGEDARRFLNYRKTVSDAVFLDSIASLLNI